MLFHSEGKSCPPHKLVPISFENVPPGLVARAQAKKHFFIFLLLSRQKEDNDLSL
jgi:hypothetical protein